MMKRVAIHVGRPKTGTTSVQSYLRNNAAQLKAAGVLYPGAEEHESFGLRPNHPVFLDAVVGRHATPIGLDIGQCRAAVRTVFDKFRSSSDCDLLVLSHESLAGAARRWNKDFLDDLLKDMSVRIVITARYTDEWLESVYRQMLWGRANARRAGQYDRRPFSTIEEIKDVVRMETRSIAGMVKAIKRSFPSVDVKVSSFDRSRRKGTLIGDILETLGIEGFHAADQDAEWRNSARSVLGSVLLFHLYRGGIGHEAAREVADALNRRARRNMDPPEFAGRRFHFLSDEDRGRARNVYAKDRAKFRHLPRHKTPPDSESERGLRRADALALLEWLRPEFSAATFDASVAALSGHARKMHGGRKPSAERAAPAHAAD